MHKINVLLILFVGYFMTSCSTLKIAKDIKYNVRFLDDYVLDADIKLNNRPVGGLSGIDYDGTNFYIVSDAPSVPRFYKAEIILNNYKIDTIIITAETPIDKSQPPLNKSFLDLESIRVTDTGFILASEGNIANNRSPLIFEVNDIGKFKKSYSTNNIEASARNNAVFEALTIDEFNGGFWVTTELPLTTDGPEPKILDNKAFVRFSHYNNEGMLDSQYTYDLERIQRIPFLPFAINGLTEILQLSKTEFITIERSFSTGRGKKAHTAQIILSSIENATEVSAFDSIRDLDMNVMSKSLLINLKSIRRQLKNKAIDNIEGICFGPRLPNGNLSLILVADNNFNSFTQQQNQFILLELINK